MKRTLATAGFVMVFLLGLVSSRSTTAMPDTVRIPTVRPHPNGIPPAAALFRHTTHAQLNCYACHPSLFPRYREGFTHEHMDAGRFCGGCHDGASAFAIAGSPCERCHVPE